MGVGVGNGCGSFRRRLSRSQAQVLTCWNGLDLSLVGPQVGSKTRRECGVQLLPTRWKNAPELTSAKLKDHIEGRGV